MSEDGCDQAIKDRRSCAYGVTETSSKVEHEPLAQTSKILTGHETGSGVVEMEQVYICTVVTQIKLNSTFKHY